MKKLKWRCRRGTKELDVLMQKFLSEYYVNASPALQHAFESMLNMQDPELYDLLVGRQKSTDENINQVIEHIYS